MAGNATVTLFNGSTFVTYEIWIQSFLTSSVNQFSSQQLRDKMSWVPIRRAEMFVSFTAIWPLYTKPTDLAKNQLGFEGIDPTDGFGKLNRFQDSIQAHQISMVNGANVAPMVLNYTNNSDISSPIYNKIIDNNIVPSSTNKLLSKKLNPLIYSGWIQQVEKEYARFKNVFVTSYTMNVITKNVANTPNTIVNNFAQSSNATALNPQYIPNVANQLQFGSNWININNLANISSTILGMPG